MDSYNSSQRVSISFPSVSPCNIEREYMTRYYIKNEHDYIWSRIINISEKMILKDNDSFLTRVYKGLVAKLIRFLHKKEVLVSYDILDILKSNHVVKENVVVSYKSIRIDKDKIMDLLNDQIRDLAKRELRPAIILLGTDASHQLEIEFSEYARFQMDFLEQDLCFRGIQCNIIPWMEGCVVLPEESVIKKGR